MRTGLAVVVACAVGSCPTSARGDVVRGQFYGSVAELSHRAEVRMESGAVVVDVERTIQNRAPHGDEVTLSVSLPGTSSVFSAAVRRDGRWHEAVLLSADEASQRYSSSVSAQNGARGQLGPMLVEHERSGGVSISIFPVPAESTVTLRYSFKSYPCLAEGVYAVEIPAAAGERRPAIRARGGRVLATSSKRAVALASACREFEGAPASVVVFPVSKTPVFGSWATRLLGGERFVADLRVFLARLSSAPRSARVVFVVDASRSQTQENIEAQLRRAYEYAEELPSAQYQIVVYRRFAAPVLSGWVRGHELREAVAEIPEHAIARGNGSRFDRGVAAAMALLAGYRGQRRIVAFTDTLLPTRYGPETLSAQLGPTSKGNTVLHVVSVASVGELTRHWEGPLAGLAGEFGGIFATVPSTTRSQRSLMSQLVRPQVLEAIRFVGIDGTAQDDLPEVASLREGESFTHLFAADGAPDVIVMEGMLWSRKVRWSFLRDAASSKHLGAYAVAAGWLEDDEAKRLSTEDGLVSEWTSYLAEPPKAISAARPVVTTRGTMRSVSVGCGGCCSASSGVRLAALPAELALLAGARGCQARFGADSAVDLEVETTLGEVVDVKSADDSPLARCAIEAAWELTPEEGPERAIVGIRIGPGPKIETTGGQVFASRLP